MVTVRHVGLRWLLAGMAMAGLAGTALAAPDQTGTPGPDSSAAAAQTSPGDAPPGQSHWQPRARYGGWDARGGPLARRIGPQRWRRPSMTLDRPLLLAFRQLDLTDQQWQRVQAILEVQQLRGGAQGGSPQQRRAQIAALFDPGDPHHGEAVQAAKDRAVARIDQAAHTQQALYEVLTPAQKTQLQQLVAQRRARVPERPQRDNPESGDATAPSGP